MWWGLRIHFLTTKIVHEFSITTVGYAVLLLLLDFIYGFKSELLNVATRHKGSPTGRKILRWCPTFFGL